MRHEVVLGANGVIGRTEVPLVSTASIRPREDRVVQAAVTGSSRYLLGRQQRFHCSPGAKWLAGIWMRGSCAEDRFAQFEWRASARRSHPSRARTHVAIKYRYSADAVHASERPLKRGQRSFAERIDMSNDRVGDAFAPARHPAAQTDLRRDSGARCRPDALSGSRMNAGVSESTVEAAALDWLAEVGWARTFGPSIAPGEMGAERKLVRRGRARRSAHATPSTD